MQTVQDKPKRRKRSLGQHLKTLRQAMPELSLRYHVKSLGVFGSYVRREQTARSDLDILVEFDQTPDLLELVDMERYLRRQLGVKVDLVTRNSLKGEIGQRILGEVVAI